MEGDNMSIDVEMLHALKITEAYLFQQGQMQRPVVFSGLCHAGVFVAQIISYFGGRITHIAEGRGDSCSTAILKLADRLHEHVQPLPTIDEFQDRIGKLLAAQGYPHEAGRVSPLDWESLHQEYAQFPETCAAQWCKWLERTNRGEG
jgi:hypothetical protein